MAHGRAAGQGWLQLEGDGIVGYLVSLLPSIGAFVSKAVH